MSSCQKSHQFTTFNDRFKISLMIIGLVNWIFGNNIQILIDVLQKMFNYNNILPYFHQIKYPHISCKHYLSFKMYFKYYEIWLITRRAQLFFPELATCFQQLSFNTNYVEPSNLSKSTRTNGSQLLFLNCCC